MKKQDKAPKTKKKSSDKLDKLKSKFNTMAFALGMLGFTLFAVLLWLAICYIRFEFGIKFDHLAPLNEALDGNLQSNILILVALIAIAAVAATIFGFMKKSNNSRFVKQAETMDYGNSKFLLDLRDADDGGSGNDGANNLKDFKDVYAPELQEPFWLTYDILKGGYIYNYGIATKDSTHSIVLGESGSGKTTKLVMPEIIMNSRIHDKKQRPSMIITDPKGELYAKTAGELKDQGYEILRFNLRDTNVSSKFNFLSSAYKFFMKGVNYSKDQLTKEKKTEITKSKAKCFAHEVEACPDCLGKSKELWHDKENNLFFANDQEKDDWVYKQSKKYKQLSSQEISGICDVLFSAGGETQNKSFYENGKAIVKATMLVLLELKEKYPDCINEDQYNMPTIMTLISNQEKLTNFFKAWGDLYPTSPAWTIVSGTIGSSDNSRGNYFSYAKTGMAMFEDEDLRDLLVKSEIDLFNISNPDHPVVVYLIIPDDRKDKHPLAVMFINQLYQALVYRASLNVGRLGVDSLDRAVLFILDEFGNMPAIPDFDTKLAVSRSRKIFFQIILQDYQQLSNKYKGTDETIKSNSPLTIYLKSSNQNTLKAISAQMGKTTVEVKSYSEGGGKDSKESTSTRLEAKDLMTDSQIKNLPLKYSIILYSKADPAVIDFVPSWKMSEQLGLDKPIKANNHIEKMNFAEDHFFNLFKFWDETTQGQEDDQDEMINKLTKTEAQMRRKVEMADKKYQNPRGDRTSMMADKSKAKKVRNNQKEIDELKAQIMDIRANPEKYENADKELREKQAQLKKLKSE